MGTIAVAGGTGTLGALLVSELRARGHDVRLLSRGSAEHPVDLTTGRGLERALDGAAVVVQAANGPPSGRAAAVLVDIFGVAFDEVGEVVGRTTGAVRQLVSRARRRVRERHPRHDATHDEHLRAVTAFAVACTCGDLAGLVAVLDPDVVWRSDGGGIVTASRRAQRGADRVARNMLSLAARPPQAAKLAQVNGAPGIVMRDADGILSVMAFTVDGGRIVAVDIMRNPEKLTHVAF